MSQAGTIERVQWCTKGSAIVFYSSPEEAQHAVNTLNQTIIPGNSRYIDVILKEAEDQGPPAKRAKGAGGKAAGGKGGWVWTWVPATAAAGKGGKAAGKGGKGGGKNQDPVGSGRVFVRGFDFGTTDDQFLNHMKKAGAIHDVHWVTKGSAVVVYKTKVAATKASTMLQGTTLPGNTRYMDVILKDSE